MCMHIIVFILCEQCYCRFKKTLDVAKQWPVVDRVSSVVVKQFNRTVLDFCNALWRCLVFSEVRQSTYESLGFPYSRFDHYYHIIMPAYHYPLESI